VGGPLVPAHGRHPPGKEIEFNPVAEVCSVSTAIEPKTKVVVSAAVETTQRAALERLAREGDRTLSQEIRRAVTWYLRDDDESGEA
jgi:hypothetical protein